MTPHPVSPRFGRIPLASLALFAVVLLSGTIASPAATKTWTGLVDNNWHEAGNWLPSGIPAGNDTINIASGSVNATPPVTIASGGTLNWTGLAHGFLSGGLTIASGGVLNVGLEGGYALYFYGGVTNAGTLRWTGGALVVYGGIVNQPGGLIDAQSDYYISGNGSIHNAGLFRKSAGSGTTSVYVPLTNNTGTVEAGTGRISFQSAFHQAPDATLAISIGGPTPGADYGHIHFANPLALDGSFTASTRNGFQPNPGDTFDVLSHPSLTGGFNCFSGVNLGGGIWLAPTITQKRMVLTAVAYGTNGVPALFATRAPGGLRLLRTPGFPDWELVTTTNIFAPVWTPVSVMECDQVTLPITAAPEQYFRLRRNN